MPSALASEASEDQPMLNAPAESRESVATNPYETSIGLSDQRIRMVGNELSLLMSKRN